VEAVFVPSGQVELEAVFVPWAVLSSESLVFDSLKPRC
jgi:hypothetical protein